MITDDKLSISCKTRFDKFDWIVTYVKYGHYNLLHQPSLIKDNTETAFSGCSLI